MSKSSMFPGSQPDSSARSLENDAKRISDSSESVQSKVYASRKLARFFEVEVTLKIFGQVIWHWVFPPQK